MEVGSRFALLPHTERTQARRRLPRADILAVKKHAGAPASRHDQFDDEFVARRSRRRIRRMAPDRQPVTADEEQAWPPSLPKRLVARLSAFSWLW
jgi:hypothetical protein